MDPYNKEKTREIWKRVLGEDEGECSCAMDSERLRRMIEAEKTDACVYRSLSRSAGSCCEALRRLGQECQCHAKKLETIYFLWTGEKACAASGQLPCYGCMAEALRCQYQRAQAAAAGYERAAEELPEYQGMFQELAGEKICQGEKLLCMLQSYV